MSLPVTLYPVFFRSPINHTNQCTAFYRISPRTAPAPWSGVRRAIGPEHEHRRCGGGGRRPGGVGAKGTVSQSDPEHQRWVSETGEGGLPPSHLSVLKLALARTPRRPHPQWRYPHGPVHRVFLSPRLFQLAHERSLHPYRRFLSLFYSRTGLNPGLNAQKRAKKEEYPTQSQSPV